MPQTSVPLLASRSLRSVCALERRGVLIMDALVVAGVCGKEGRRTRSTLQPVGGPT